MTTCILSKYFEGEGCDQLKGLKSTFNDDNERMLWRTKQCLGNSFILFYETVLFRNPAYHMHVKWFMDYAAWSMLIWSIRVRNFKCWPDSLWGLTCFHNFDRGTKFYIIKCASYILAITLKSLPVECQFFECKSPLEIEVINNTISLTVMPSANCVIT